MSLQLNFFKDCAMKKMRIVIPAFLAVAAFSAVAGLPAGMTPGKTGTLVSLSAEATISQANDQATVNLYCTQTGKDATALTRSVLEITEKGLATLKALAIPDAKFKTTELSSWPQYVTPKKGEATTIGGWQVRQSLSITVKDAAQAARIIEAAQPYFAFDGISFSLSQKARQSVETSLIDEAMTHLGERATQVARSMGKKASNVKIESLDFGQTGYPVARMLRAAKATAFDATENAVLPTLEAGESNVTLRVNAQVRIK